MLKLFRTTHCHSNFWRHRKLDWRKQLLSFNHPHRTLIVQALQSFNWFSLWEIGCGSGANLVKIFKELPGHQLGGSDINAEAIKVARETFMGGTFHCEDMTDLLLSDRSVDVILSDASLMYIGTGKIKKTIHEMARVARVAVVINEFHSNSWLERIKFRLRTGYNIYNYKKLLENAGLFDIQIYKIPPIMYNDKEWDKYGSIIIAKITNI